MRERDVLRRRRYWSPQAVIIWSWSGTCKAKGRVREGPDRAARKASLSSPAALSESGLSRPVMRGSFVQLFTSKALLLLLYTTSVVVVGPVEMLTTRSREVGRAAVCAARASGRVTPGVPSIVACSPPLWRRHWTTFRVVQPAPRGGPSIQHCQRFSPVNTRAIQRLNAASSGSKARTAPLHTGPNNHASGVHDVRGVYAALSMRRRFSTSRCV